MQVEMILVETRNHVHGHFSQTIKHTTLAQTLASS